jgi:hypothetical protein
MFFLLLLTYTQAWSYHFTDSIFRVNALPEEGLVLDTGWKYMPGDNGQWAKPDYNDSDWQPINPSQDIHGLEPLWNNPVCWFRLRFSVDSSLQEESLALLVEQTGAS